MLSQCKANNLVGPGSAVGSAANVLIDNFGDGGEVDQAWPHNFRGDHEIISTDILSLPLTQEGRCQGLSVTGELIN